MDIKNIYSGMQSYLQNRVDKDEIAETGQTDSARSKKSAKRAPSSSSDKVNFSDEAKLFATSVRTAQNASGTRADKVAALKAQVEAGTYQPDSRKTAENMLAQDLEIYM
ncbi:flagellar biosynthesis anti-sigma factor FlgM [Desulfovibrio inopinatus]|uniref:flagellar biosynthesis anti-sigma factor FlgM n=1 Tax=Desulfovibrio inopinatus TaxID=102109 RepID=UPI00040E7409|nr:flagellar biosynthesis anti-sigma factor FlgM [Desulfovibrio inopinatus]